jgi:hypothetical protein
MENITYRTNLLETVNVDNIVQKDMGSMDFGDFDFGDVRWYRCSFMDVGRPDRISKIIYDTTNYWHFLMWFNGISDCWNDIRENMMIKYPDINLVREAFKLYRKKEK